MPPDETGTISPVAGARDQITLSQVLDVLQERGAGQCGLVRDISQQWGILLNPARE